MPVLYLSFARPVMEGDADGVGGDGVERTVAAELVLLRARNGSDR